MSGQGKSNETAFDGQGSSFPPVADMELLQDVRDMRFDRAMADEERLSHLMIRVPLAQKREDFSLTPTQIWGVERTDQVHSRPCWCLRMAPAVSRRNHMIFETAQSVVIVLSNGECRR